VSAPRNPETGTAARARLARLGAFLSKLLGGKRFLGKAPPGGSLAWRPEAPGSFRVRAVDDQGQADSRLIELAVVP